MSLYFGPATSGKFREPAIEKSTEDITLVLMLLETVAFARRKECCSFLSSQPTTCVIDIPSYPKVFLGVEQLQSESKSLKSGVAWN
jgi:hypothetical protein